MSNDSPRETQPWWTYRARDDLDSDHTFGVVDGDTLDLTLDLGLTVHASQRVRLAGVDTAETYGVDEESREHQQGERQSRWVRHWMRDALTHPEGGSVADGEWPLVVHTVEDESGKYGRYLARVVRRSDGECLNEALVAQFPSVSVEEDDG